jgi:hypothetical protein
MSHPEGSCLGISGTWINEVIRGRSKDSVGLTPKEWKESRRGELGAVAVNGYKLYQPIRWDYSDFDEDSEPGDD